MFLFNKLLGSVKSDYFKAFTSLSFSYVLAQILGFVSAPIMSRLFTPSEYGALAIFTSIGTIFSLAMSGRYELAFLNSRNTSENKNILALCFFVSIATFVLMFFGVLTCVLFGVLNKIHIGYFILLLPVYMLARSWCGILNQFYVVNKNIKILKKIPILLCLTSFVHLFGLWLLYPSKESLIAAAVFSQVIVAIFLIQKNQVKFEFKKMKSLAVQYISYPKYQIASSILALGSTYSLTLILGHFYGLYVVGLFGLVERIFGRFSVLLTPIESVFRQRASQDYREKNTCRPIYLKTLLLLLFISGGFFSILFIFAPQIVSFVFGAKWLVSAHMLRILIPCYVARFICMPLTSIYFISRKNKTELMLQFVQIMIFALLVYLKVVENISWVGLLYVYSVSITIMSIFNILLCLFLSKNRHVGDSPC